MTDELVARILRASRLSHEEFVREVETVLRIVRLMAGGVDE